MKFGMTVAGKHAITTCEPSYFKLQNLHGLMDRSKSHKGNLAQVCNLDRWGLPITLRIRSTAIFGTSIFSVAVGACKAASILFCGGHDVKDMEVVRNMTPRTL